MAGGTDRREGGRSRTTTSGYTRLFINLGKTDNFFAGQLIELVNKNTHKRVEIGRIDLMKNFSFFEVENSLAESVIGSLNKSTYNGRKVSVEIAGDEKPAGNTGGGGGYAKKKYGNSSNYSGAQRSEEER